ncbi:hypothetical protein NITLEN_80053 [Nitrospira lenta]|uniref:Uncharacterized protein n=1 Tax=Nitrospira lenta TaxID=1436998 RepID=A0A330L9E3_9BACT|nr:hypothetical protein NITLEN_80053 [Nitrospira lenta]
MCLSGSAHSTPIREREKPPRLASDLVSSIRSERHDRRKWSQDWSRQGVVAGGRSSTKLKSHLTTIYRLVSHTVETHGFLSVARLTAKEENAHQYGQPEEKSDNVFHHDTFRRVKNTRPKIKPPSREIHREKRFRPL